MNNKLIALIGISLILLSAVPGYAKESENFGTRIEHEITISTSFNNVELVKTELINHNIRRLQFKLYDDKPLPITLDILWNVRDNPEKTIYMLPGTALNFESNFLTPTNNNIALFRANDEYLVVGITPREDNIPEGFDQSLIKDWGLEFHRNDVEKVIDLVQSISNNKYEIACHSVGCTMGLDIAGKLGNSDSHFKGIRIIDMIGQYPPGSANFQNALSTYNADVSLISLGYYSDPSVAYEKQIIYNAMNNPIGDSGVPRVFLPGNFTNYNLAGFALINTGTLPGIQTGITGLPGSWYLTSITAGTYNFALDPNEDSFLLNHTDISTIYLSTGKINSGLFPLAFDRDMNAMWTGDYPVNWSNIKVPVTWINAEQGFGSQEYSISLLASRKVTNKVVSDYGHGDPVYSNTAQDDFWEYLFP